MRIHHRDSVALLCKYYKDLPSEALRARLLVGDSNEDLKEYIRHVLKERGYTANLINGDETSD